MKFHSHICAPARLFVRSLAVFLAICAITTPATSWAAKPDHTAPTVPTGLTATAASCSQVNLSWNASTDASGIKQYNVSRNGVLIKTVLAPATSTSDTTVAGATTYSYTVSATDNKGNTSVGSSPASVTTPSCNNTTTYVTISLSASPSGAGAPSGGGSVVLNSTVTVSANPSSCYNFVSWTENGTVVSTSTSYSFTATANRTLVANYSVKPYTVSVSSSAGGTASGGGTFNCGSTATVTATASSCYHFVNWTENGSVVSTSASYSFTVSANRTLVANFAINPYTITTGVSPASSGSTTGSGTYNCGSTVTVSATAAAGYTFANWTENGSVVSTSASYSFSASANRTLTANFTAATCSYSLNSSSASFAAAGGSSSFGITAGSTCSWTASTTYSWITVNSSSGTGNGNVYYTVAANTSTSSRSGTITVAGQTFTISQAGAPAVSLTTPTSGSTISNTVATAANASSSSSIAKVEFYCDSGVLIGTATASPYSVNWNTTNVANGAHSVYAKAYDSSGSATTSTANSVTVNNTAATTAPTGTPGQLLWVKGSTAAAGPNAVSLAVATDQSGNSISVGWFTGTVDFGMGPLSTTSTVDNDGFIAKYDSQGHALWTKRIGSNLPDSASGVCVDSLGNIYVTGYFSGTVDFGGTTLTSYTFSGVSHQDIFVAKYSPNGVLAWVKQFGGALDDQGIALAVDGNDNIILASQFKSVNADFGGILLSSVGYFDVGLMKISSTTGSTLWATSIGGTGNDMPTSVATDRAGDVILVGGFAGANLAKFSGADGSLKWSTVVAGTTYGVATDPNTGNIVVTGNNGGIFLSGLDPNSNLLWTIATGGGSDSGRSVCIDTKGNLALAGQAAYAIDFGVWPNDPWLQGNGQPNVFVAAFSISGNTQPTYRWTKVVGANSTGHSMGGSIASDSLGHVLVAGSSNGTIDFGGTSVSSVSGYDAAFVSQYAK